MKKLEMQKLMYLEMHLKELNYKVQKNLALKAQLPDNPEELPKSAERLHDSGAKLLGEIVAKGLAEGIKYREMRYRRDLELINILR